MSTPIATIANAIIDFILSLLRDPAALAEFEADPEGMLSRNGLDCVDVGSIRAAAPVVYDRPEVVVKAPDVIMRPTTPLSNHPNEIVREYSAMTQTFTWLDNRATIVDQSTNQNIWTEGGDVAQVFDQVAGVASGDAATAAGRDINATGALDTEAPDEATFPTGDPALPVTEEDFEIPLTDAEPAASDDSSTETAEEGLEDVGGDQPLGGEQQLLDEELLENVPGDAAGDISQAVDTAAQAANSADAAVAAPVVEEYVEPVVEQYVEPVVEESDWDSSDTGTVEDDGLYDDAMTEEQ